MEAGVDRDRLGIPDTESTGRAGGGGGGGGTGVRGGSGQGAVGRGFVGVLGLRLRLGA